MQSLFGNALPAVFGGLLVIACGGGGSANPDAPGADSCTPTTCEAAGATCGALADGCGGELECGGCAAPETCGGAGVDNACGRPCVRVGAALFDLGDTLIESNGAGRFVERAGAPELIADLIALGLRVGVITNTPEGFTLQDLRDLLVNPSFLDAFEFVLLSSEAASPPKPDPAIFVEAHGLLANGPPIEEVAFVTETLTEIADREVDPTIGARAAGMVGVHLSAAPPSPLAHYTVAPDALAEIATIAETEWLSCVSSRRAGSR